MVATLVTLEPLLRVDAVAAIMRRLQNELPVLRYHCVAHTLDVLHEALLFARHDGLDRRTQELIAVAAAYHDAGYLERYEKNESIGARMADEAMLALGRYREDERAEVRAMILSTELKQTPQGPARSQHSALSAYIMDADWGSFGRNDFFEKCDQLIEETDTPEHTFLTQALTLLESQRWLTPSAHTLRQQGKLRNIQALKKRIELAESSTQSGTMRRSSASFIKDAASSRS